MSGKKRKHSGDDAGISNKKVHHDSIVQDSIAKKVRFTVKDVGEWAPAIGEHTKLQAESWRNLGKANLNTAHNKQ